MMIRLVIKEIIDGDNSDEAAVLILKELRGNKELPITLSMQAAENIKLALNKNRNLRPDIYDSFIDFINKSSYKLEYVCINKYEYGVFYSYLSFADELGNRFYVDQIRPSDAIILVIKKDVSILCENSVLDEVACDDLNQDFFSRFVYPDFNNIPQSTIDDIIVDDKGNAEKLSLLSLEEINLRIEIAVKNEDYQYAAKLRDARNKK
ncbi:bifunctional nuclease family protein [Bacteroidales bacterium OttesenSCG-928-K22]|nr:bifunctional nuclease family protein [Bacteroidales bacterium OttesenSCG-928-L14]MDL2240334.1 bifunctional nuclease family protein [Bacteroidales bacterium OttesenSCG-928-K22]